MPEHYGILKEKGVVSMRFWPLVKLGEWILGKELSEEKDRADLYLPLWMLAFGIALILGGIFMGVLTVRAFTPAGVFLCVTFIVTGVAAILYWRNQTVEILSPDTFRYTNPLGRQKIYRFADIQGVKRNKDSMTLILTNGKVPVESIAIVSPRLAESINRQLEEDVF